MKLNSLPVEIIREIFCNIDCRNLPDLMVVCKFWNLVISTLLNDIHEISVPKERKELSLSIFHRWSQDESGYSNFSIYQTSCNMKNLINPRIIRRLSGENAFTVQEVTYRSIVRNLESYARYGRFSPVGMSEDVVGDVWRTLIGMTGWKRSAESLKETHFLDKSVNSFMSEYRWYIFKTLYTRTNWDIGIIALFPNNRKFTMIIAENLEHYPINIEGNYIVEEYGEYLLQGMYSSAGNMYI